MTATLHSRPASTPLPFAIGNSSKLDRIGQLALFGPLLLFVHGIVAWVDGLDATRGTTGTGPLAIAAALALAASVGAMALLATELAERTHGRAVAAASVVLAAFGAGATGAVALGRATGVLSDELPVTLSVGGPVILALGLAVALARLVVVGRMRLSSALLAGLAAALVASPFELLPLGALMLMIALGPLTQAGLRHQRHGRQPAAPRA